jgi:hypothetical protein
MLRPLYRCVLHLHPPGFRQRFGDEMLSILDHTADKWEGLRLLLDCVLSLGRQWTLRSEFWHDPAVLSSQAASDGVPSFCTLDRFRPRTGAMIQGLMLSAVVFSLTCFAIRYSWIRLLHVHIPEVQFETSSWAPPSATPRAAPKKAAGPSRSEDHAPRSIPPESPSSPRQRLPETPGTMVARNRARPPAGARNPESSGATGGAAATPPMPQGAAGALTPTALGRVKLDAEEKQRVIHAAAANLKQFYVDPEVGQKMAEAILAREKNGAYAASMEGTSFAGLLTTELRDVSQDRHLIVEYSLAPIPDRPAVPSPEALARDRRAMAQRNCRFEKVATLPHNIGYLKLNSFPDASLCKPMATAAMASLNNVDAIIFDLRDNGGGYPDMVALLAAYLFDHPEYIFNPRENTTERSWTRSPVPGNKLADKPVYVLTSAATFSGAEQFCYNLKMLKRATIVGEATRGGAHAGVWHRIDEHFGMGIPEARAINPFSKTDWEGTGVEPDVRVKAADALETAERLAERKLRQK